MARFEWLSELLARFADEHILVYRGSRTQLAPAHLLHIDPEDWALATREIARYGCRWCALWAEERPSDDSFLMNACYEQFGDYVVLRTQISITQPLLASQAAIYPAAARVERQIHDLFGIEFTDQLDKRRWLRHQAWGEQEYPLRHTAHIASVSHTPVDDGYPFLRAQGAGVCELPVGPVHAGIIEPGHFRFQTVGESILNLEIRLGYVHKGTEKIAQGRDGFGLARLAGRVSGDTTVGHSWAACMALERAAGLEVPPRALMLRAIMAERERVANHLGDIGAICNDVGFSVAFYQFSRLRELWLRLNHHCWQHRLMMDQIIPGGVTTDLTAEQHAQQQQQIVTLSTELTELELILNRHSGLKDRLATTGILSSEQARQLGCLGYVGRASGQNYDLRRDSTYPPYDQFPIEVAVHTAGDVEARVQVRLAEIRQSLRLLQALLSRLPQGALSTPWQPPAEEAEGLGFVEGWRGELITYVRLSANGLISRFYPRDPSGLNWPALELLIRNNIVADFPVCNKSVNGSYAGHDL